MSTTTGGTLNLIKPELTDDHKVTIGTDLPANFQKIDDTVSAHLAENVTEGQIATWNSENAAGTQTITFTTLVGKNIKKITCIAVVDIAVGKYSHGYWAENNSEFCLNDYSNYSGIKNTWAYSNGNIVYINTSSGNFINANVSVNGNIATLTWGKVGSPTGNIILMLLAETH